MSGFINFRNAAYKKWDLHEEDSIILAYSEFDIRFMGKS